MNVRWLDQRIDYDGSQLAGHWILRQVGLVGDACVAFRGACKVSDAEMADVEDLGGPGIAGDDMLHFLLERFDDESPAAGILRQRLFACLVAESLAARGAPVRRDGDDLFVGPGKLSISIATRGPTSALMHFALNVGTAGTPVLTAGLDELGIDVEELARDVLERYRQEQAGVDAARTKVRAKGEWVGPSERA